MTILARTPALPVALALLGLVAWLAPPHPWRLVVAWTGIALAMALTQGASPAPPHRPLAAGRLGWAALAAAAFASAALSGWWRGGIGLDVEELLIPRAPDQPLLAWMLLESGLPSYLHNPLIVPAHGDGGIAWIVALHAGLAVVGAVAVLHGQQRSWGPRQGAVIASLVLISGPVLAQQAALRAYATYLPAVWLGTAAMLPGADRPRRDALVALGLAIACLDAPIAVVPLVAYVVGRWTEPDRPRLRDVVFGGWRHDDPRVPLTRGALLTALAVTPTVWLATMVKVGERQPMPELFRYPGVPVALVLLAGALILALRLPRWRPAALAAGAGLAATVLLIALGTLTAKARYLLFVAPLVIAVGGAGVRTTRAGPLGAWVWLVATWVALTLALDVSPRAVTRLWPEYLHRRVVAGVLGSCGLVVLGAALPPLLRRAWSVAARRAAVTALVLAIGLLHVRHLGSHAGEIGRQHAAHRALARLWRQADPAGPVCGSDGELGARVWGVAAARDVGSAWAPLLLVPDGDRAQVTRDCPGTGPFHVFADTTPPPPNRPMDDRHPRRRYARCEEVAGAAAWPNQQLALFACP